MCSIQESSGGACVWDGPGDYADSESCTVTAVGEQFDVTWTTFDLEASENCDLDFIKITTHHDWTADKDTFCGQTKPPDAVWRAGDKFEFTSDKTKHMSGWMACASFLPPSRPPPSPPESPSPPHPSPPPYATRFYMKKNKADPCADPGEPRSVQTAAQCEIAANRIALQQIKSEGGVCSPDKTPCDPTFQIDTNPTSQEKFPNGCYYFNDIHDGGDGTGGKVWWNPVDHWTEGALNAHPICIIQPEDEDDDDDTTE